MRAEGTIVGLLRRREQIRWFSENEGILIPPHPYDRTKAEEWQSFDVDVVHSASRLQRGGRALYMIARPSRKPLPLFLSCAS